MKVSCFHLKNNLKMNFIIKDTINIIKINSKTNNKNSNNKIRINKNGLQLKINKICNNFNININS